MKLWILSILYICFNFRKGQFSQFKMDECGTLTLIKDEDRLN